MDSFFSKVDENVFRSYAFWAGVLGLKMLAMSILTGIKRTSKKVFANPEDAKANNGKVVFDDPDVERVRRAHRNDMENILPYFVISFLYMFTNPSVYVATMLFRVVSVARIVHTVVYALLAMPPQIRGLSWAVGYFSTAFMAVQILLHFC